MFGKLQNLLDQELILSCARQFVFSRYIGNHTYTIDEEAATLSFADNMTFGVSVIGSESFAEDQWTWAWADPQYAESKLCKSAQKLRKLGLKQELTLLTRKQCAIDTQVNGFTIASVARSVANATCFYSYDSGNDVRTYVLLSSIDQDNFTQDISEKDILKAFESLLPHIKFDHYASVKHACVQSHLGELVSPQKISLHGADLIFDEIGNCLDIKKRKQSTITPVESIEKKTTSRTRRSRGRSRR